MCCDIATSAFTNLKLRKWEKWSAEGLWMCNVVIMAICKVQGHVHMCKYKLPLEAETANWLPRLQPDQQGTQRTRENVGKSQKNPKIKGKK